MIIVTVLSDCNSKNSPNFSRVVGSLLDSLQYDNAP